LNEGIISREGEEGNREALTPVFLRAQEKDSHVRLAAFQELAQLPSDTLLLPVRERKGQG